MNDVRKRMDSSESRKKSIIGRPNIFCGKSGYDPLAAAVLGSDLTLIPLTYLWYLFTSAVCSYFVAHAKRDGGNNYLFFCRELLD